MPIYEFEGLRPRIAASAFIHPTAVIIGDVTIGENCFILPHATLRGDLGRIEIGDGSNVQDNCVIHVGSTLGKSSLVGHSAIIHGAKIGNNVIIGMGAIILDDAEIGDACVVGAGALVSARTVIPPRKVVLGMPATVTGEITPERERGVVGQIVGYEELGRRHAATLREISLTDATRDGS